MSWLSSIQGYPKDDRALTAGNESQIDADLATIADADGHRAYARLHLAIGDKDGARESLATSRCRSCGTCYKDSSAGSASRRPLLCQGHSPGLCHAHQDDILSHLTSVRRTRHTMAIQPQLCTVAEFEHFLALPKHRDRFFELLHSPEYR